MQLKRTVRAMAAVGGISLAVLQADNSDSPAGDGVTVRPLATTVGSIAHRTVAQPSSSVHPVAVAPVGRTVATEVDEYASDGFLWSASVTERDASQAQALQK